MENTKTTKTTAKVTKKNTKKEEVVMKETTVAQEVAKNETKKDTYLTIQEVRELYAQAGIKVYNPDCKGNYCIMGTKKGSSLNVQKTKGYKIYSTDEDYKIIKESGIKFDDLVVEEKTNAQDKVRPNTISCTVKDTLIAILKLYATNPLNAIPVESK